MLPRVPRLVFMWRTLLKGSVLLNPLPELSHGLPLPRLREGGVPRPCHMTLAFGLVPLGGRAGQSARANLMACMLCSLSVREHEHRKHAKQYRGGGGSRGWLRVPRPPNRPPTPRRAPRVPQGPRIPLLKVFTTKLQAQTLRFSKPSSLSLALS